MAPAAANSTPTPTVFQVRTFMMPSYDVLSTTPWFGGPEDDHRRCELESDNTTCGHLDPPSQSTTYFQFWMALLCKDSGVSSVNSMRPIYGSVMLARIAFVSLWIVSLTVKPLLLNLATASA